MAREKPTPTSALQIDENLRLAYEELMSEALPPRFEELLNKLRSGEHPVPDDDDEASS